MFFYEDHPEKSNTPIPIHKINATNAYLKHFGNSLVLKFFLQKGTTAEKMRASKELVIAERKMKYWQRQSNYNHALAIEGCSKLKKPWDNNG